MQVKKSPRALSFFISISKHHVEPLVATGSPRNMVPRPGQIHLTEKSTTMTAGTQYPLQNVQPGRNSLTWSGFKRRGGPAACHKTTFPHDVSKHQCNQEEPQKVLSKKWKLIKTLLTKSITEAERGLRGNQDLNSLRMLEDQVKSISTSLTEVNERCEKFVIREMAEAQF